MQSVKMSCFAELRSLNARYRVVADKRRLVEKNSAQIYVAALQDVTILNPFMLQPTFGLSR